MTDVQAMELGRRWLAAGGGHGEGWQVFETDYGTIARLAWRDADHWHAVTAGPTRAWLRIRHENMGRRVPDLRDPATKGAALEVVRERWGDPGVFIRPRGSKARPDWAAFTSDSGLIVAAPTEAEALVAALEAAGGRSDG